jgi:Arc/MetJ family transcription regulator
MGVHSMRTNIEIRDDLMSQALNMSGLKTKKEVVELAITEFIEIRSRKNLEDLRGKIAFSDDYDHKTARENSE